MHKGLADENEIEKTLERIRTGLINGVRREVATRRRMGLPLVVSHGGVIEVIHPARAESDSTPDAVDPDSDR